ncbi:MAG: hypothetical protein LQ344_004278 [Seirophora lacunosa]|nr:MAG: hypothetical protein LQ344_004278 [Seirophora lacunosa]
MHFTNFLVTFLLALTAEAQGSQSGRTCSLSAFDRCGPANQAPGTPSTCNATITNLGVSGVYTSKCIQNPTSQSNLIRDACIFQAGPDICNRLTDRNVLRDQWVWSNAGVVGCALGFWLPSGNGTNAAFPPDYNRCMYGIFNPLVNYCTNPTWNNAGSVNLKILPNATQSGEAVDPFYPSYVVAPSQLTAYAAF